MTEEQEDKATPKTRGKTKAKIDEFVAKGKAKYEEGKAIFEELVGQAKEAPIQDDQRQLEAVILTALAKVIGSDVADLKYDLLMLDPSDFYFSDHRDIYSAMKELDRGGDHVDQVTVSEKIGGGHQETLKAIFAGDMPEEKQVQTYRKRILDRADVRQLWMVGHDFLANIKGADAEDRVGLVANLQAAVFDFQTTKRLVPEVRAEADVLDDFALELEDNPAGYSTGFRHLNRVIGGLKPGLFVIAGPPSAGKTTFVKQLADQVAASEEAPSVLFFTYEQSAFDIRVKTLARLSRISNEVIKRGEADLKAAISDYKKFGQRVKIIEGDRQHTVGTIRLMTQRERQRTGKSPIIVVDYLQVMPVSDPNLDRRAQVDFIVTELRRVARDTGASIVAVSSISRGLYNEIKMNVFKESGGIEYGADVAAIMKVEKEDDSGVTRDIQLAVVKNRHGRRGAVDLFYKMAFDSFEDTTSKFISYVDTVES